MSVSAEPRPVGVDLQENEENRALVEAIEADNEDLNIRHMPGMIRLTKTGQLVINQASLASAARGRPTSSSWRSSRTSASSLSGMTTRSSSPGSTEESDP
jgi:hypothetical protein